MMRNLPKIFAKKFRECGRWTYPRRSPASRYKYVV